MQNTLCDKIIDFNSNLGYVGELPEGFKVMNPFIENPETMDVMRKFYRKFYDDNEPRKFIVGINPSRHGAGVTGVPFTDTKRLANVCGIEMKSANTHEVSSVFVYDMIEQYGGVDKFYREFYINSPFPLAIVRQTKGDKWVNANYYDDPELFKMTENFMIESLKKHIDLGLDTSEVFVLGKKNAGFIDKLNKKAQLFNKITILEHPRFIQQYKSKEKQLYIDKYILSLTNANLYEDEV